MDVRAMPMLRRNVDAFIKADPVTISLQRVVRVDTPAGAWTEEFYELPPQEFRLVPFKRRLTSQESNTQDGAIPHLSYSIVGRYTVDIAKGDIFDLNGDRWRVVGVEPNTDRRSRTDRVVAELEVWRQ
jgi:hypothetical protein